MRRLHRNVSFGQLLGCKSITYGSRKVQRKKCICEPNVLFAASCYASFTSRAGWSKTGFFKSWNTRFSFDLKRRVSALCHERTLGSLRYKPCIFVVKTGIPAVNGFCCQPLLGCAYWYLEQALEHNTGTCKCVQELIAQLDFTKFQLPPELIFFADSSFSRKTNDRAFTRFSNRQKY